MFCIQWIVQTSSVLDQLTGDIIKAIQTCGNSFIPIGHVPFEDKIIGLEDVDPEISSILFGSTRMVELFTTGTQLSYRPGVFYEPIWFDPRYPLDKRRDMLNQSVSVVDVAWLREHWTQIPVFIKSISVKAIKGMVIEPDKNDYDTWLIEHSELNGDEQLVISPIRDIEREWRFFVVSGQVIAGSLYKRNGCNIRNEPIPQITWDKAHEMASKWLPHPTIVMDICQLYSGEYKITEFNCLNSSGIYKSDFGLVLRKLTELYGENK